MTSSELPSGWEAKLDEGGKVFFIDHSKRLTTREDPRQLPKGWSKSHDSEGNIFFLDHSNRKTTRTDPRPRLSILDTKQQQARAPTVKDNRTRDKQMYTDALRMAMADDSITAEEEALVLECRVSLGISDKEHAQVLLQISFLTNSLTSFASSQSHVYQLCVIYCLVISV